MSFNYLLTSALCSLLCICKMAKQIYESDEFLHRKKKRKKKRLEQEAL
jgi:hypothetical protein